MPWKTSHTVLIHKGRDASEIMNCRPIALGSSLRKASKSRRLSHPAQQGFIPQTEGKLLEAAVEDVWRNKREIAIAWLDLADAFGSLPHYHILRVLRVTGRRHAGDTGKLGLWMQPPSTQRILRTRPTTRGHHLLRGYITSAHAKPVPHRHGETETFVFKDLEMTNQVFVRNDATRTGLQPPYDGPFEVLEQGEHFFRLNRGQKEDVMSLKRLKPAYILADENPPRTQSSTPPSETQPHRGTSTIRNPELETDSSWILVVEGLHRDTGGQNSTLGLQKRTPPPHGAEGLYVANIRVLRAQLPSANGSRGRMALAGPCRCFRLPSSLPHPEGPEDDGDAGTNVGVHRLHIPGDQDYLLEPQQGDG
ncbi:hypothetical protein J437_LFUL018481 [Ladona fulva]|uniref:Reverse transcriptase domain-containing protein n=1 Tax=Ladona fulva TaxID=123851 RepID=A0A8K0NXZ2_LADFU|nr:hypothetical protein J437_LFUL018481 [Ladona fulva]